MDKTERSVMDVDEEWMRQYCRQIALPEVDLAGQQRLQGSRALVVGAGGLGSTAAMLLAGAGVGTIELMDDDQVEVSNLHRQIGHTRASLGLPKVQSLAESIHARYPHVEVIQQAERFEYSEYALTSKSVSEFEKASKDISKESSDSHLASVIAADIVLDCTDNFQARYRLNHACWWAKKPLVSAAAIRLEGQLTTFDPRHAQSPCYACLYPPVADQATESCLSQGVLGPVPSVLASLQSLEACRVLLNMGETLVGRLLLFDAMHFSFRSLQFQADPNCAVCG